MQQLDSTLHCLQIRYDAPIMIGGHFSSQLKSTDFELILKHPYLTYAMLK